jgi:hypothetical protein
MANEDATVALEAYCNRAKSKCRVSLFGQANSLGSSREVAQVSPLNSIIRGLLTNADNTVFFHDKGQRLSHWLQLL